jgi:tetrahydromethanopterin S-methyltransferase subunit G
MISKSLPAVLQQALEYHVNKSQLTHDDELQGIYDRLTNLNEKVEFFKNKIKSNREKKRSLI